MKNRQQRREYQRSIKNDKRASKCPKCGHLSLFYSTQIKDPFDLDVTPNGDGTSQVTSKMTTAIKCEICDNIIYQGEEVEKLIPPGVILPLPLYVFDYALRHPEVIPEEEKEE